MAEFVLEESEYAGPIPEGEIFEAEVVSVKQVVAPFKDDDGNDIRQVEFKFVIDDADSPWDGTNVYGNTGVKFNTHPDCKLKNWSQEILASELPSGFKLDTDDLVGNRCRILVGAREKEKDGEKKIRNFVQDVMRSRGAMSEDEEPF